MQSFKLFASSAAMFMLPVAIVSAQIADAPNAGPCAETVGAYRKVIRTRAFNFNLAIIGIYI